MVSIMYLSGHIDTSPIGLLVYVSEGTGAGEGSAKLYAIP